MCWICSGVAPGNPTSTVRDARAGVEIGRAVVALAMFSRSFAVAHTAMVDVASETVANPPAVPYS